jgi:hypothetical protein
VFYSLHFWCIFINVCLLQAVCCWNTLLKKSNSIISRSQWSRGLRRRPWSLGRWHSGFETRLRHGCLSSSSCVVLSCVGRGLCGGLITHPEESYRVYKWIKKHSTCEAAKVLGPYKDFRATDEWIIIIITIISFSELPLTNHQRGSSLLQWKHQRPTRTATSHVWMSITSTVNQRENLGSSIFTLVSKYCSTSNFSMHGSWLIRWY